MFVYMGIFHVGMIEYLHLILLSICVAVLI